MNATAQAPETTPRIYFVFRIAHAIDRSIYRLNWAIGHFAVGLLLLLAFFVFANLVSRWFHIALPWLFDISIAITIAFTFLIAAYTLGEGRHIHVDVVTQRLNRNSQATLEVLSYVFVLFFSAILLWQGVIWILMDISLDINTGGTTFGSLPLMPMWYLTFPVPFGAFLLILAALRLIVKKSASIMNQHSDLKSVIIPVLVVIALFVACLMLAIYINPLAGLFLALLVLLFSGVSIAFSLAVMGMIGIYFFAGGIHALGQLAVTSFGAMESFPAVAVPLFIIIGAFVSVGGWAEALADATIKCLNKLRGSLVMVTVVAGCFICALTGSSVAATSLLSIVFLPLLLKRGYDTRLSCGVVAGSGAGALIPPSAPLILFGLLTETSLSKLFMAVLIPGLLVFGIMGAYVLILSFVQKNKFGAPLPDSSIKEKFVATRKAIPILLFPIIVLGGIYVGFFTATEAAAVSVVYGIAITLAFSRNINLNKMRLALLDGGLLTSMISFMLVGGIVFGSVIAQLQIGNSLRSFTISMGISQVGVIIIMSIILFILGMFMSSSAMMMLTIPIFYPLALAVGIHPLWLAVFMTLMGEVGLLSPPVALLAFVVSGISKVPLKEVFIGIVPFLFFLILDIILIYFFPVLVEWLPKNMIGS